MLLFAAKNRPFTEIVCRNRKITARNRFRAIDEPKYLSTTGPLREWPRQPKQSGRAARQRHAHVPLPEGTAAAPGVTTTPAFSMSSSQNAGGIGATTGKLGPHKHRAMRVGTLLRPGPQDRCTGHRAPGTSDAAPRPSRGPFRQAIEMDGKNIPKSHLAAQLGKGRDHILATDQKADTRTGDVKRPESEKNSTPTSSAPGYRKKLPPGPPLNTMSEYALSWNDEQVVLAGEATISCRPRACPPSPPGWRAATQSCTWHASATPGSIPSHIGQVNCAPPPADSTELGIGDLAPASKTG